MASIRPVSSYKSFNPFWANAQLYSQLAKDSFYTSRWQDKLRVWFGRTGWRPKDVAERFPFEKAPLSSFKKFHPALAAPVTYYSVAQHVVLLSITVYLLLFIEALSGTHQLILVATIVAMSIQNGFILSGSKLALALEGPRLLIFPLMWLGSGLIIPAAILSGACLVSMIMLVRAVRSSVTLSNMAESMSSEDSDTQVSISS